MITFTEPGRVFWFRPGSSSFTLLSVGIFPYLFFRDVAATVFEPRSRIFPNTFSFRVVNNGPLIFFFEFRIFKGLLYLKSQRKRAKNCSKYVILACLSIRTFRPTGLNFKHKPKGGFPWEFFFSDF